MTENKRKQNKDKEKVEVKKSRRPFKDTGDWGIADFISGLKEEIPFKLSDIVKLRKTPLMDVRENNDEFTVIADVPGIDKKNLEVEADENSLTVSGQRSEESLEEGESLLKKEIYRGSFSRCFTLPLPVDPDAARTKYSRGVLTVILPKKELKDKKTLKVNDG